MNNYILSNYNRINLKFINGKGSWLYTKNEKYLDFSSGIAVNCLGHSNTKLIKALEFQSKKLWHTSNLYRISEQEILAKKLCEYSFADKAFFCNSGAEAMEAVVKIIRRYHYMRGDHNRKNIIVLNNAFHGRTLTTIQAGSNKFHREGFLAKNNCDCGFSRVLSNDIAFLEKKINKNTAAILFEPIQGEGGINTFSKSFFKNIKQLCKEKEILLAFDEVQSGIARTGKVFSYEWYGAAPDIISLAKGLGGGFPIGAVLMVDKVSKCMGPGTHGSTFGGNQLACSVALAVMKEVAKKSFLSKVQSNGTFLKGELKKIKKKFPNLVSSIKGKGLLLGIELKISTQKFCILAREKKLLLVPAANNVVRLLPPLNVKKNEIYMAIKIIQKCLEALS